MYTAQLDFKESISPWDGSVSQRTQRKTVNPLPINGVARVLCPYILSIFSGLFQIYLDPLMSKKLKILAFSEFSLKVANVFFLECPVQEMIMKIVFMYFFILNDF